jgi:hypothetical protein
MAKKKITKPVKKVENRMEIELCPFSMCRGKAQLIINPWGKYVECKACGACGPQFQLDENDKLVIDSWNNR